ncbi:hypothetical protein CIB84_002046 [Bambusicola thoracicus]|uniref:Uncharacterized protein n=1 Tax=Bambusicola thoracicus TaxID=9083 RepID=A0A2P4TCX0_BAMTH|nr:hypothetical protein CIB84_002046 [Bambusicola thoracicus]
MCKFCISEQLQILEQKKLPNSGKTQ